MLDFVAFVTYSQVRSLAGLTEVSFSTRFGSSSPQPGFGAGRVAWLTSVEGDTHRRTQQFINASRVAMLTGMEQDQAGRPYGWYSRSGHSLNPRGYRASILSTFRPSACAGTTSRRSLGLCKFTDFCQN